MIQQWKPTEKPDSLEIRERIKKIKEKWIQLQRQMKENGQPVIVLIEGWGAAGKGSAIGSLIREIDPRFFQVVSMAGPTEEERRRPFLYRYFVRIPEAGKFVFYDSGWGDELTKSYAKKQITQTEYELRLKSIERFERQLSDNGYKVLKFFFHISQKEQKKRLDELAADPDTSWRVSEYDRWQNKHYEKCLELFDDYLKATDFQGIPWRIVDAKDKKWALLQLLEGLCAGIEEAPKKPGGSILENEFEIREMIPLSQVYLNKSVSEQEYKEELEKLQDRLKKLHYKLYREKIPVILVFEGWDGAGKGGIIKRLAGGLDPRGYEVHPIAAPEPGEKSRHYLWRFWKRLPKSGHVAIFDRSWYGRVMVERIEGFCSVEDWNRAYQEINEFEWELFRWGAVIIKFWVQIDKETQLIRFQERENTPEKRWKITPEDWRNREKWDRYEEAVDEMLQKTGTEYAPWHILESVDKRYGRLKALRIVTETLENVLKKQINK